MSQRSRGRVLGFGLALLVIETILSHPAIATDKISLFKVVSRGPIPAFASHLGRPCLRMSESKDHCQQ